MNDWRAVLPRPVVPPLWREATSVPEALGALRHPAIGPRDSSASKPVLLIPGFLAGDSSLRLLAGFLARSGYEPLTSGIARNVDCAEASVQRLEQIVEARAQGGSRVALVGHSRGGLFARALAVRRPDLVAGVVMLGSPHRDQLAVHPVLWTQIMTVALIGASGAAGVLNFDCATGACCTAFRRELTAPLPPRIGAVSVYSRNDGVVDWRACIDESATNVEVSGSHIGMIARAAVFRVVADALATLSFAPARESQPVALHARRPTQWRSDIHAEAA